ncbi:MAG TPA: hypothetical protein VNH64_11250, partial [Parvularculaceae bacterium]|nr:hypothetical protein [Parvularculaceae bacterium]
RYRHRNEGAYTSYSEPGRQIARYALRDGRTAFFFCWTDKGEPAPRHHDIAAERAALRKAFDGAGWEWPEIETGIDSADDLYLDSVSQVKAPAWSKGRVALLGDAACCPSLLAGQGAAFAMAGAYLLAGELAKSGGVYSAAYARYEEIFRPFVEKKQLGAVNFAEQFAPKTALSLWLRNLSTRLLAIPLIGQWLMHGMVGDDLPVPNYRQYERVMA